MTAYTAPLIISSSKEPVSFDDIVKIVCEYLKVNQEKIFCKTRSRDLVEARQFIMLLCKRETALTLKNIGKLMGGLDHTTIMYGYKNMQDLIETDLLIKDKWHYFKTIMQLRYRNRLSRER